MEHRPPRRGPIASAGAARAGRPAPPRRRTGRHEGERVWSAPPARCAMRGRMPWRSNRKSPSDARSSGWRPLRLLRLKFSPNRIHASGKLGLLPLPLAGEGWGGGELAQMSLVACPLPVPPPQAGEGTMWHGSSWWGRCGLAVASDSIVERQFAAQIIRHHRIAAPAALEREIFFRIDFCAGDPQRREAALRMADNADPAFVDQAAPEWIVQQKADGEADVARPLPELIREIGNCRARKRRSTSTTNASRLRLRWRPASCRPSAWMKADCGSSKCPPTSRSAQPIPRRRLRRTPSSAHNVKKPRKTGAFHRICYRIATILFVTRS